MTRAFHPRDIRRAAAPAALVAAALLVASCGGGGQGAEPKANTAAGSASTTAATAGAVLAVTATEYAFTPSKEKASAGPTTIRLTNKGLIEHDITIDALKISVLAKPGKTTEATATLKPGTYKTYCAIPGHKESGMQGTLTVQ